MLKNTRRRNQVLTLAVLTLLVGLPNLALAQQSGLFPNASIRRVRPPCDQEDSVYKLYKHQYYGYHPTCWRRFPDGWGCPSPEAPDREKSFREIKKKPPGGADMAPDEGDEPGPGPGGDMERPANKPDPSPFELPAVPEGPKSPFDLNNDAPGAKPANPPQTNRAPSAPRINPSDLGPAMEPPATGRTTSSRSRSRFRDEADDRPILAMADEVRPEPDAPADADGTTVEGGDVLPAVDVPTPPSAKPAPAPARRGMISGLFGGNGWSFRRR